MLIRLESHAGHVIVFTTHRKRVCKTRRETVPPASVTSLWKRLFKRSRLGSTEDAGQRFCRWYADRHELGFWRVIEDRPAYRVVGDRLSEREAKEIAAQHNSRDP